MRLAIMQPYFLPYIGYFQLIHAVDTLILYDNIKYTKRGWINRNRFLRNGKDALFSIPLKSASDALDIRDRHIADDYARERLLSQFAGAYKRAPYFLQTMRLAEEIIQYSEDNLYGYLWHSITKTCQHIGISTALRTSSEISIDHSLKSEEKVLALCAAMQAKTYINLPGGAGLYSDEAFRERGIELRFIQPQLCEYSQLGNAFVPWLSIVDVLMFNSVESIRDKMLPSYQLAR